MFSSARNTLAYSFQAPKDLSATEEVINDQAIVFSGHLAGYILTQYETIREKGSFEAYEDNFLQFRFDPDNSNWNFIGHTYTGSQVYLYYRARKYSKKSAFVLSFLSSLWFETIIENYTEPPSIQDVFNTPIFGSALGYGIEEYSMKLLKSKNKTTRIVGRLLNPFSLLVEDENITFIPSVNKEGYKFMVTMTYD